MQTRNLTINARLSASYTTTNAWANIAVAGNGGLVITVPEDGNYDLCASFTDYTNNAGEGTHTRFAVNGNPVSGSTILGHCTSSVCTFPVMMAYFDLPLKAGDVVSVQALYNSAATQIYITTNQEAHFQIIKRGL